MTIREMMEKVGIDEDPLGAAFTFAGGMRTALQGEPSTFEGECASLVKATEAYGRMDDPANVRRMMDAFATVIDVDIPNRVWQGIVDAMDADEAEDATP